MKRHGLLHGELASRCARAGHGDLIVVADCGLPVPLGVPVVDLAVVAGTPRFAEVLAPLLDELVIESHIVAVESTTAPIAGLLAAEAPRLGPAEYVLHEQLKRLVDSCAFVVRTGEATPYANVLLRCGVAF